MIERLNNSRYQPGLRPEMVIGQANRNFCTFGNSLHLQLAIAENEFGLRRLDQVFDIAHCRTNTRALN
ncbi:hypothetical protein D3C87_2051960 [compost metagenome]